MNIYIEKILTDNGFTVSHFEESITKEIWRSKLFTTNIFGL